MHVCMHVCMYVCTHIYIYTYGFMHMYMYTYIGIDIHACIYLGRHHLLYAQRTLCSKHRFGENQETRGCRQYPACYVPPKWAYHLRPILGLMILKTPVASCYIHRAQSYDITTSLTPNASTLRCQHHAEVYERYLRNCWPYYRNMEA